MSEVSTAEYELFTRVRLKNQTVGTIVDRLGKDYIIDIGHDEKDWDTIIAKLEDIEKVIGSG